MQLDKEILPVVRTMKFLTLSNMTQRLVARFSSESVFSKIPNHFPTATTRSLSSAPRPKKRKSQLPDTRMTIDEAVTILKSHPKAVPTNFFKVNIKCAPMHIPQPIQKAIIFPHACTKKITILCFAEGKEAEEAKAAGADIVGSRDLVQPLMANELKFDLVLSTPEAFEVVKTVARILGPMGHMPSLKKGTVTTGLGDKVEALKVAAKYKCSRNGDLMMDIGQLGTHDPAMLRENLNYLLSDLIKSLKDLPTHKTPPKEFISKVWLTATTAPAFPITLSQFNISNK